MRLLLPIAPLCCALLWTGNALAEAEADMPVLDSETETVIQGNLRWLASKQLANGSWSLGSDKPGSGHAASMTGYALMAFLANGHLPEEGEYAVNVTNGLNYLLNAVQPDGILRGTDASKYMYSHGLVTTVLAQCYGQTRAADVKAKLEKMVGLIVRTQNKEGGWRYSPRPSDADISVTVLQVVGLRAAQNAGISVPVETINRAVGYVRACKTADGGFAYQAKGGQSGFARTAAAVYSLQVCGQYEDPLIGPAVDYLFEKNKPGSHYPYALNYAAPGLYMIGDLKWKNWYAYMKETLLPKVKRQGDLAWWDADSVGQNGMGAVYSTAVFATALSMPNHYIPLYQR